MKHIVKKRFTDKQLVALILLASLVVLVIGAIILTVIKNKKDSESEPYTPPEIIEGEALYGTNDNNKQAIAYPNMDSSAISYIEVIFKEGSDKETYGMYRPSDGATTLELFYLRDGKETLYYPQIALEDATFDYESIYSIADDGFNQVPKLYYLLLALRIPSFEERIQLSTDEAERRSQLNAYGFNSDSAVKIYFAYDEAKLDGEGKPVKDDDGNTVTESKSHTITLGGKDITGNFHYFRVDDREYIYSTDHAYFDDAVAGFSEFIKPTLIAAGISTDIGLGPTFTQGYYQWKETQNKTEGETVPEDSRVTVFADVLTPPTEEDKDISDDGYLHTGYNAIELDLTEYKKYSEYSDLLSSLIGKQIGSYGYTDGSGSLDENIIFTVIHLASEDRLLDFSDSNSLTYSYTITAVDSVVSESKRIVQYTVTVGDKTLSTVGVIDLTSSLLPSDAKTAISEAPIGALAAPVSFTAVYTKDNAITRSGKYKVIEITEILDESGAEISKVTNKSTVTYKYRLEVEGADDYEQTVKINLAEVEGDFYDKLKKALKGESISRELDITVDDYTAYFEFISDFEHYRVSRIDWFVTSELVSAFKFVGESNTDPFYGGSLYENLMDNEYKLYGLNEVVIDGILRLLGGITEDSSSLTASGLSGKETVAVGISPELMDEYKLYANKITFSLPRGIEAYTEEGEEEEKYSFSQILTFTVYLSNPDPVTGERYAASDMYDIITIIDGDGFEFLDSDFASFWARRSMLMLYVDDIQSIDVEFGFSDITGRYDFDLSRHEIGTEEEPKTELVVKVTPSGECTSTKLLEYIEKNCTETGFVSLGEFFSDMYPDDPEKSGSSSDTVGTNCFRDLMLMIYHMDYEGLLTDAEQEAAFAKGQRLLRIELKTTSEIHRYVYEFYVVDASRIMVSLHKENSSGTMVTSRVSEFYISTFAFKKIALNGFYDLLNGVKIDIEEPYPDRNSEN